MKILITGSTGFIGINLVSFLKNNNSIVILDASRDIGFDLSHDGWTKNLPKNEIDVVIHLAQSSLYRNFPEGATDIRKVNIDSTAEILEWARINKIKKFIFASTGSVYENSKGEKKESDTPSPNSFYGVSKLTSELMIQSYSKFFDTIILRIFGAYGPDQNNMLIPNMINKIKNSEDIPLASCKGLYINPIYIDDLVQIIKRFIDKKNECCDIFNIGGPEILSLHDIVLRLEKILDIKANIEEINAEPAYAVGSISKIKNYFSNLVFTDIDDGLNRCVNRN